MDYAQKLMAMVDRLLAGEWSVPDFERHYYWFFLDDVPDDAGLSDAEWDFFGSVQEKLEWTAADPGPDQRDGWIDHLNFIEWVRAERGRILPNLSN